MKAVLCKEYGPPETLVLEEIDSPPCGAGEVRIAVRAAGVNFPDLLIIEGKYQFQPPMPFSPGSEVSGVVTEVGRGVEGLSEGDRVIGLSLWNGFAEEVVLSADQCLKMPDSMDFESGAVFGITYGTGYHALVQRGRLSSGETLLVHGATGGTGTAAIEIGLCLGATVIPTSSSDEKLAVLKEEYSLEHAVNVRSEESWKDHVKAITNGVGADVIYDPVGGEIFEHSLRCIAWNGRLLVIGFASGSIPSARANLVLLKGCSIVGVFWGSFSAREPETNQANFRQLFEWYEAGRLRPRISHRFGLEQAADALNALAQRKVIGKAVLTLGPA